MNSCTFTPAINRTRNSVTRTTPATQASTPFTPRMTMRQIQNQTKSPSHSLETSSDGSGRIQRLYQDGVRLRQSRPVSQRHERELREKRIFERQRGDCTFRPKIWTKPYITPQKKMTPPREKSIHNPPLRVVTTHAPSTPKGTSRFPHVLISPLRDPTVAEQLEIDTIGPSLAERTEYGSI